MNPQKVSIIIPVYNVEKYIRRCIDSVLSQTFTDFECILVDDCSSDKCPEICDEYAKQDARVKVIHKIKNEGPSRARKTGFESSFGEYIQFVDSDDWIEPDMLEKMYSKAILENDDMVYCDYFSHDETNIVIYKKAPVFSYNFAENIRIGILAFSSGGVLWNKLVKRDIYEKIDFPIYGHAEDKYITTQILFFSRNIGHISSALYHYCFNNYSMVNSKIDEINKYKNIYNNFQNIFNFLKTHYQEDLSIFEPELSTRIQNIKTQNPEMPINILKRAIKKMMGNKLYLIIKNKLFLYNRKNKLTGQ